MEQQTQQNGYQRGQHHALYGNSTKGQFGAGQPHDHNHSCHGQVTGFAVVNLLLNQKPKTGSRDNAKEQHTNAAHDRAGDSVDQLAQFPDKGKQDSENCSTADDPYAVYFGNSHNANIFPVSCIRRGAKQA